MQEHGIPAAVVTKFLSSRRIEIEKTGLYSFLVLFSMGITKGKWSTLVTELLNFKDLYDANAPLTRVLPALAAAHPEAYAKMGLKDLCEQMHHVYREDNLPKAQQRHVHRRCPRWRCGRPTPTSAWCAGEVESVEIDDLMGRTLAVMVVPYPPGIPLIMPGERITAATKSIQDYLLYAREFDQKFPGFETDIHGLRFEPGADGQALSGRLRHARERPMIPRDVKAPTVPIPFHKLLKVVAIVDATNRADEAAARPDRGRELRSRGQPTASSGTSRRMPRSAPTSRWSTASASRRRATLARSVRAHRIPARRFGRWRIRTASPIMAVLGLTGEVDGYIYLGQQTPAFYAKQIVASLVNYGMTLLPPFFGGLMAYDGEANIAFDCPGPPGRPVLPEVAGRPALLQAFRREHLPQRSLQCRRRSRRPADPRGPGRRGAEATRRGCSAPTRPISC